VSTDGTIRTISGREIWLLQPRLSDIDIDDIAHALSHVCRFGGHVLEAYSVAQHAFLVSLMVPPEDALWGLLHDASEAYLNDVVGPLKHQPPMAGYRALEGIWQYAIYERFGLVGPVPESVLEADQVILRIEQQALQGVVYDGATVIRVVPWVAQIRRVDGRLVVVQAAERARAAFRSRFDQLTAGR
jgi:5'-deoxynucleotidase YfbR-like HD superfamily hydrolase